MNVVISENAKAMGQEAAEVGAEAIRQAITEHGQANIIVATGASQFETLEALVAAEGIDWSRVVGFHLDEYIGVSADHPASFCGYLKKRFVDLVSIGTFHYVDGDADPEVECSRLGKLITHHPIDVAFVGIGENGHLAFNDPPADFETEKPYLVVELDDACRQQQFGEGWFESLDAVPTKAISMSIRQIMRTGAIVCSVPDERKAQAVASALEGSVTPNVPASILQEHGDVTLFLDDAAASRLTQKPGLDAAE
jgi:glucosamine-6-phosphate deaminase